MQHFDLVIIGTGSANSIPGPELSHLSIALVEDNLFGGTCLNVGCIPSKMFGHTAELAASPADAASLGVDLRFDGVDWPAIRDRIFARIDAIEAGGRSYREGPECPNVSVFEGHGRFTGAKELTISLHDGGTEVITGTRFVVGAGSRAVIPEIKGLSEPWVSFHTSDTIMRLNALPSSMAILGGGYIAAEFAHIFSSFGVAVTQIVRGPAMLRQLDADVSELFTQEASGRYDVRLNTALTEVSPSASGGVSLQLEGPDGVEQVSADVLLIAIGRTPNADRLEVAAAGIQTHSDGRIAVDECQQSSVPGIFALGDISSSHQLKHVANYQARVVQHNLIHPDEMIANSLSFIPAAVFAEPQIATVGLTEKEATEQGIPYVVKTQKYADIAAGWAREDRDHFLKVLADPATGLLLGAHAIGPEAATVIQPLIQAMSFGQSAHQVARGQYWIHPALSELVENALLGLPEPSQEAAP